MTNTQFHDNKNNYLDPAVNSEDALDFLRQRLEDSFPGGRFGTEDDPTVLAVAAIGSIGGVLKWVLRQVQGYHPDAPSLVPIGLVQIDLPTLGAAYAALLSGIGASHSEALQQADPECAETEGLVPDALSSLCDVLNEMGALLDSKEGFPPFASAMTVRELEMVVGPLAGARLGIAAALGKEEK